MKRCPIPSFDLEVYWWYTAVLMRSTCFALRETADMGRPKRADAAGIRRRSDWADHVAMDFSPAERQQLDWSARRGVPIGDATWVESVANDFKKNYHMVVALNVRAHSKKQIWP